MCWNLSILKIYGNHGWAEIGSVEKQYKIHGKLTSAKAMGMPRYAKISPKLTSLHFIVEGFTIVDCLAYLLVSVTQLCTRVSGMNNLKWSPRDSASIATLDGSGNSFEWNVLPRVSFVRSIELLPLNIPGKAVGFCPLPGPPLPMPPPPSLPPCLVFLFCFFPYLSNSLTPTNYRQELMLTIFRCLKYKEIMKSQRI